MLRSLSLLKFVAIAALLAQLFMLQCAAAPQVPTNSNAAEDSADGGGGETSERSEDKNEDGEGKKGWAEIIGIFTVIQDHPVPSLYTFLINEYDASDAFVRQSGCFQDSEYPGDLSAYTVSIGMSGPEFG